MASTKVTRRRDAMELGRLLDSPEIVDLIRQLQGTAMLGPSFAGRIVERL